MCVSFAPAYFSKTKIYVGLVNNDNISGGRVLMYQNQAESKGGMPNGMLLHIPTETEMGPENFIDMSNASKVLKDMENSIGLGGVTTRGVMLGADMFSKSAVQVFESGMYHIVLADNAEDIRAALEQVPEEKRPLVNPSLLQFYQNHFGTGYKFVMACFNSQKQMEADPIALWYIPSKATEEYVIFPALDCHTGNAPDIYENVDTDHSLFFGGDGLNIGQTIRYSRNVPSEVAPFLPKTGIGAQYNWKMQNGDFRFPVSEISKGRFPKVERFFPGVVSMNA